jgi:condensin complex subunit 1
MDVLVSGLNAQTEALAAELESSDNESLESFRKPLEMYSFLLLWIITSAETLATQKTASASKETTRGRQSKAKQAAGMKDQSVNWDYTPQLQTAFDVICKILKLKLVKVWTLTSEKDTLVRYFLSFRLSESSLYTRPAYLVAESEQRLKNTSIKMRIFKVLCLAVKHQQHGLGKRHRRFIPNN